MHNWICETWEQLAAGHAGLQSFTAQYFVREEPQDEVACSISDSV